MHIYCTFTQICFIMHLHKLNLLYYVLMILIVHACLMHLTCRLHPCMLATCVLHGCYMHATFNIHLHAYIITLWMYNKHACTYYVTFMLHTLHLEQGSCPMLVLVDHIFVYSSCSIIHQFLPLFFLLTVYCYGTPALFLIPSLRSNSLAHSTSSFIIFVIFCCNKMLCAHIASMCLYAQFVL